MVCVCTPIPDFKNAGTDLRFKSLADFLAGFSAGDGESFGVYEADLGEDAGLVPVDVFVGDFAVVDADNDDDDDFDKFASWLDVGEEPVDDLVVGEGDGEFIDDLLIADRLGKLLHLDIFREEFADKVIGVEGFNAFVSEATHQAGDVEQVGVFRHGGHGGGKVALQFGVYVLLEQVDHGLLL